MTTKIKTRKVKNGSNVGGRNGDVTALVNNHFLNQSKAGNAITGMDG